MMEMWKIDSELRILHKKQNVKFLKKMLELGYIDQEKYDEAVKKVEDGLKFKKGTSNAKKK